MVSSSDILLSDNNELIIVDGDFSCGESSQQEVGLIVASNQGDWKQDVMVGVEIYKSINASTTASNKNSLVKRIKSQLEYDGFESININSTDLKNIQISCERIQEN